MKLTILLTTLSFLFIITSCKTTEKPQKKIIIEKPNEKKFIKKKDPLITGVVVYITGKLLLNKDNSWSIITEFGKRYKLKNLPDNYKEYNLRVRIKGNVIEGNSNYINVLEIQDIF